MGNPPGGFGDGGAPPPDPIGPFPNPTPDPIVFEIFAVLNFMGQVINQIISLVIFLGKFLTQLFRTLGKFLLHVWQNYVKAAITWLATHVQKLRAWLKRTIGPILARLEKIKKWYDTHILKQQLRMLQFLQSVRRILGILRIFHVKWAIKLDGALADLQNRIETSIAIVRGTLNQIINTLAIAFDPTMLLRTNVLGASLLSNLGAVKRIFGYGDNRLLSATEQATIDKDHALYTKSTVDTHVNALVATGLTDDDKARRTEFRTAFEEVRGAPLPI